MVLLLALVVTSHSDDKSAVPLRDVSIGSDFARDAAKCSYQLRKVECGAEAEPVVMDCGTLTLSTIPALDGFSLTDVLKVDVEGSQISVVTLMRFEERNLLCPKAITHDVILADKSVRLFTYENGRATMVSWFDGTTNHPALKIDEGIVSLGKLLRIAPLLSCESGATYQFTTYAVPFLFLPVTAEHSKLQPFTISAQNRERISVNGVSRDCLKYRVVLGKQDYDAVIWVDDEKCVVRFMMSLDGTKAVVIEGFLNG